MVVLCVFFDTKKKTPQFNTEEIKWVLKEQENYAEDLLKL